MEREKKFNWSWGDEIIVNFSRSNAVYFSNSGVCSRFDASCRLRNEWKLMKLWLYIHTRRHDVCVCVHQPFLSLSFHHAHASIIAQEKWVPLDNLSRARWNIIKKLSIAITWHHLNTSAKFLVTFYSSPQLIVGIRMKLFFPLWEKEMQMECVCLVVS